MTKKLIGRRQNKNYMLKRKILVLLLAASAVLIGCNKAIEDNNDNDASMDGNGQKVSETNINSSVEGISVKKSDKADKLKDGTSEMPYYYLDSYDFLLGSENYKSMGNKLSCLSMIYSYYNIDSYVEPEEFARKFAKYIDEDGRINDGIYEAMAEELGIQFFEEEYDTITAASYLKLYRAKILIKIERPSIFGRGTSYIVLSELYDDNYFIVRDPIRENIDSYAIYSDYNEPMYDIYSITEAMGKNGKMYVFY